MRKLLFFIFVLFFSCRGEKRYEDNSLTDYQKKQNEFFKDASRSPLKAVDLKNFKGLDFFKFDSTFVVYSKIQEFPESLPFKMKTNIGAPQDFRVYGKLTFNLNEKEHTLSVYENLDKKNVKGYENYLFLPFLDQTNGYETYGGGRYIDIYINDKDSILIDFNKAYNPQCVYNEDFSCPIVPRENLLEVRIEAGVKNYIKN